MRNIPFFNYPALFLESEKELMSTIHEVLSRGAYVMQRDLIEFEENVAQLIGAKHVIGVADGTIALVMGLRASGVGLGDEVLVPSHTFVASAAAINHSGAKPVLVDCGRDHLIDPEKIEAKITGKTRGIMPVQLNGRTANMDKIIKIANHHKLKIVEDSAQALGSKFKGQCAGTFGAAGTCSFYPSKTLGCFGDGGAVITNDDEVASYVRLLRDHGRDEVTGDVVTWGYNARLDNVQAAVLNYKLKNYENIIDRRRDIATRYQNILGDLEDLILPPAPGESDDHFDIFQNYEIESGSRDRLRTFLAGNGVQTIIQWGGKTIHQFKELGLNDDVPFTEKMTSRFFLLPMHAALSNNDVDYIGSKVCEFYDRT